MLIRARTGKRKRKYIEHDQELPMQDALSKKERPDIIPGDKEIVETPPPNDLLLPAKGPDITSAEILQT